MKKRADEGIHMAFLLFNIAIIDQLIYKSHIILRPPILFLAGYVIYLLHGNAGYRFCIFAGNITVKLILIINFCGKDSGYKEPK